MPRSKRTAQEDAEIPAVRHQRVCYLSEQFLEAALRGGIVNLYQGSTDEVALRCIAFAESLIKHLALLERGEQVEDARRIAQGEMVPP